MTVTRTVLTSGTSDVDGTSQATASISPGANRLLLAWVWIRGPATPAAPTLAGNGLTWVQVATENVSGRRFTLFRAMGAGPSAGAVTITETSQTNTAWQWIIVEYDVVDTTGTDGSGAVVQSATASGGTATSITVTLAAFGSPSNATAGGFSHQAAEDTVPGAGFAEDADVNMAGGGNNGLMVEFRADNDTSVDASWATTSGRMAIAVEIKAAPQGSLIHGPGPLHSMIGR